LYTRCVMNPRAAKITALAVTLVIASLLFYFLNQGHREPVPDPAREALRETEIVVLLSAKFGLGENNVSGFLADYRTAVHDAIVKTKGSEEKPDLKTALITASAKYGIPLIIAAEIVILERLWIMEDHPLDKTQEFPDDDWEKWIRTDK